MGGALHRRGSTQEGLYTGGLYTAGALHSRGFTQEGLYTEEALHRSYCFLYQGISPSASVGIVFLSYQKGKKGNQLKAQNMH